MSSRLRSPEANNLSTLLFQIAERQATLATDESTTHFEEDPMPL